MSRIVDRRLNNKNKSAVNRQRFLRRFHKQIRKAISHAMPKRGITDTDQGETVNIPAKDLSEPSFKHGLGGKREMIYTGNKEFSTGDRIERPPPQGQGQGNASNQGESEDDFVFELSREEFLEFFFDDLELPNLVKTQLKKVEKFETQRAGYQKEGMPSNINIVRSMQKAYARRIALTAPYKKQLKQAEKQLQQLIEQGKEHSQAVLELKADIETLQRKIQAIPFIDTFDIRYNSFIRVPKPTTQAVMFCIMDVSGSMGQYEKDVAKRFFILLYLFLNKVYKKTQIIFIRHHTIAKEVDEEEFFHSRESGGTVVSSALKLMKTIIQDRFATDDWNIYVAQASDGDNWNNDSHICRNLLNQDIMPYVQYYAYIEITQHGHQSLWREYQILSHKYDNFAMQHIQVLADIYPVFRQLFQKKLH